MSAIQTLFRRHFMKKKLLNITLFMLLCCDLVHADSSSNISISTSSSHTVTGLYLQSLATGTCPGTSIFNQPSNSNYGTMWTGGVALNNQSMAIGANYLYEMINLAIFEGYYTYNSGISPATPGSNSYNSNSPSWCINLGIAGGTPVSPNASVTTSLLPYASSTSISITCNDTTKQCLTSSGSTVTQTF